MSVSIGELSGVISLQDNFSGPIGGVAKQLGITSDSFKAVTGFAAIAAGAVTAAAGAIVTLGIRGAVVADVEGAFDDLTAAAGSSAGVMLGELQEATLGTISKFDLMRESNALLSSGLLTGNDDMKILAGGAKLLADMTGGETAAAFGTLSGAILSGRGTQLAQMGLFVDSKRAVEEYERAHGKLPGTLTEAERKTAIAAATVAELKKKLEEGGPAVADFGDMIDIGKVAVQNFTDQFGVAIAKSPVVMAGMLGIRDAVQAAFGGSQQDTIKTLMGFVNDFAIKVVDAALVGVTGAGIFVTAWSAIKTAVLGVITAVSGVGTALVGFVGGVAELGAKIPGVSGLIGGFAEGAKALEGNMKAVTLSLAAETAEAARGVTGNSDLHRTLDTVAGTLLNVRDKMVAAKDATAELTTKATDAVSPLATVGTTVAAASLSVQEMMDALRDHVDEMLQTAGEAGARFTDLQNAITLASLTGSAQRLAQQEIDKTAELTALQEKLVLYPEIYDQLAGLVTEKYRIMGAAAQGFHSSIVVQASMSGLKSRTELQATAANAIDTYNRMKDSNEFTADEIRKAWEKMEEAKRVATGATRTFTVSSTGEMLTAVSGAMEAFGVRYKGLALAGAILSGISAVQKALAAPPGWPFNAAGVITVTAMQLANVAKIRSSGPGFATGTGPGGQFRDFGAVSTVNLHGPEAIIPRAQGDSLAEMFGDELKLRDDRTVRQLERMEEAQAARDRLLPIRLRDAVLLAGA